MRRLVSFAAFLSIFAFVPLAAQDDGPNVFRASYYKARPGKQAAYNAAVREYVVPLNDELVRRGHMVSYQTLVQDAGAGEFTNVHIFEFSDWGAVNLLSDEEADDACRAVFNRKTCQEKLAEYGNLSLLRTFVRQEYYESLKP